MAETLQIRNVPEDLHAVIAERARGEGLTISQYLLRRIAQIEGKATIDDTLADHWQRTSEHQRASAGTATALLADDRDR